MDHLPINVVSVYLKKTQLSKQTLSGVICDCDGTIIESALDFQEMYRRGEAYALSTGTVLGVCQVRFFELALIFTRGE